MKVIVDAVQGSRAAAIPEPTHQQARRRRLWGTQIRQNARPASPDALDS
jgi:hypothetical protein